MAVPKSVKDIKVMRWNTFEKKMLNNVIGAHHWKVNKLSSKDFEDFKKYLIDNRESGLKGLSFYKLSYNTSKNKSFIAIFKEGKV